MSTSPFMDDYSSEDYSDHEDDYYFVPVTATTSPPAPVDIQTPVSDELQNQIIDNQQQEVVTESVYFDVLPEVEVESTAEEVAAGWMEQSIYWAVESYFDGPEAQAETGLPAALETETVVEEGDVIGSEALEIVEVGTEVEFVNVQVGTGVAVVLEAETVVEGDAIKSEALGTAVADTGVEIVKAQVETCVAGILETAVVEEDVVEELPETADATLNPDTAVEEEDVFGDPSLEAVESVCDVQAETEAAEDLVEEEDDFVDEQDDTVEEGHDFVEEERLDVIDREPLESHCNLQGEAEALVVDVGVFMEKFNYEPLPESDSDLEAAEEPDAPAIAEPAVVSIEMISFKAQEPEDLTDDEQSDSDQTSCEEFESDMTEESERDSDAEESDLNEDDGDSDAADTQNSEDSADDSDPTEEEEDDVVVPLLNSSTRVRSTSWSNSLVPPSASRVAWGMWGKHPITYSSIITFETEPDHSSFRPSFEFLGCRDCRLMLLLQEFGNAVMNVIQTWLCELSRIRNDLRRALGALFRKRETTKHS